MILLFPLMLAAVANAAVLPEFSFGEHNARQPYNMEALKKLDCERGSSGTICSENISLAHRYAVLTFVVFNQHLSRLLIGGPNDTFSELLGEMKDHYGSPCEVGTETITTGIGIQLQSRTFSWCFATGKMVLHERSHRLDEYGIDYIDLVNRPG